MRFVKLFSEKRHEPLTETGKLRAYREGGDVRLLGSLYEPYMEMVFSICYKYLRDEEEAKDAVMQLFEKLVFDLRIHEVSNFKSWLHSVVRNYCLMEIRARKVFSTNEEMDYSDAIEREVIWDESSDALLLDQNLSALENCMKALTQEQRSAIQLFFLEEKCYREIADETGVEINKVKSYIQNGKRNLKICMDKNG